MPKSTVTTSSSKPEKPYPEFPLFAHASGRWAKKVKGKLHYFGGWDDPDGALARWEATQDDLLAGREPSKPTTGKPKRKPAKPSKEFPLFVHASGRWAKKVRGKLVYFGKSADDPKGEAALALWLEQKDDLLAGRTPRTSADGLSVRELCNQFLAFKERLRDSGELAPRTWDRYYATCEIVLGEFGRDRSVSDLRPEDFMRLRSVMSERLGAIALGNEIQMVRSLFRYGYEAELLDVPVRFGPGFKKPSAKAVRQARTANGPRLYSAEQLRALLENSTTNMRAMILLGVNGGLGNTDLATMPLSVVDLENGWLDYARAKTAIMRRIPLWRETVQALREVIAERRQPIETTESGLVFVGKRGQTYVGNHKGYRVTQEFDRVAKAANVSGRTFYDLRRTFQTIGEGANDLAAVQHIMGHAAGSQDMSAIYRQTVSDERLRSVAEFVRGWLFARK